MIKSETIGKVAAAFVKAQAEMGNASKGAANPFFKSKYADLNAIREAALPVLKEQGLSIAQPTVYIDGKKFVQTTLLHESGEYIAGLTEILSVKEHDAQAQGSGISYARRYGLQSLLCIGAEDDDGESAVGRKQTTSYAKTVAKPDVEVKAAPVVTGGSETPPKKTGGFGAKKVEVKVEDSGDGWE